MSAVHNTLPPLRVPYWIDAQGQERGALSWEELGSGYKVIFCFKASCPGCHSRGFPAMKKIVDHLTGKDFGFAAIHTAFDDDPQNSQDRVAEMQKRYDIKVPFGHDPKHGGQYPTFMNDFKTRGTPFFVIIDPSNRIVFSDFNLDADKLIKMFTEDSAG